MDRICLGLAATALAVLAACAPAPSTPPSDAAPSAAVEASLPPLDWVGGAACAECHSDEAERWLGSHHDLAMQPASEETVLGDFDDATFTYAGTTTTFYRRDGGFWVRTDGPAGALADYRVAYAFGVEPLQQYLIELGDDGRLQALSVCWDTRPAAEGGQRWFHLYPDETVADHRDVLHWTGPLQNWNFMCAECHSTGVRKGYEVAADRYATTYAEVDVACEACHGPGSRHVAWAENGGGAGGGDGPGLSVELGAGGVAGDGGVWRFGDGPTAARTVARSSRAEIEVCARCHSRRAALGDFGLRHGRPLADSHRLALLEEDLYHADGQIRDEVYVYGSFVQSKMYHQGVTCGDCHDPHGGDLYAAGNAVCAGCHRPDVFDTPEHHFHPAGGAEAGSGSQCVDCHMPARTYMVVDPRRDHGFRVPRPDLGVRLGTPDACTGCHADRDAAWAAAFLAERRRIESAPDPPWHFAEALHAARTWRPEGGELLRRTIDDPEQPAIVRATAVGLLGRYPGPASWASAEGALFDPDPLVRRAAVEALEGLDPAARWRLVAPLASDPTLTVRLAVARVLAAVPPAAVRDATGAAPPQLEALAAALGEYREVQRYNADRAEGNLSLGWLHLTSGEPAAAEAAYSRALERQPRFVPTYVNLADLYRAQGREDEAEALLRRGIELVPDAGYLHHVLGLALVRQQRPDEALAALAKAVELDSDTPRFAYTHGVALHSFGDPDGALAALAAAHRRFPADRSVLETLIGLHRERGEREAALVYARRLAELAPQEPGARQLVAALEAGG